MKFEDYQVIQGHVVEFIESQHIYLVDGVIVPSVTQVMNIRFKGKYSFVPDSMLEKAAERGTAVHNSIQSYEECNIENGSAELRNYKFIKKHYELECICCEQPIIIPYKNKWVAGRFDLLMKQNGKYGIVDIKNTSTFDKEYVAIQTNLYRKGYMYSFGKTIMDYNIEFLGGIHLYNDKRKYYEMPIKEDMVDELLEEYFEKQKNESD